MFDNWQSRVTTFYRGPEAAAIIARGQCRAIVKAADTAREYGARPFDFADLQGKLEPERWGPKYSKPAKRARFNDETNIPTNCASGQKRCFSAAKHRAKIKAEFAARAAADQREWALGKAKSNCVGLLGLTIEQAYAKAMAEKATRLAGQIVAAPVRLNVQPTLKPSKRIARRAAKRVLEAA